jgi:uncharacterized protein YceK
LFFISLSSSMKHILLSLLTATLLTACGSIDTTTPTGGSEIKLKKSSDVTLVSPQEGSTIQSPVTISGTARGTWFFEGSLPVTLLDSKGTTLAQGAASAEGEWMTEESVPFSTTLTFSTADTAGTIVIKKDNPSGEPDNEASVAFAVKF